jgi:hypothetical protein
MRRFADCLMRFALFFIAAGSLAAFSRRLYSPMLRSAQDHEKASAGFVTQW